MRSEDAYWQRTSRSRVSRRRLLQVAGATGTGLAFAACAGSSQQHTAGSPTTNQAAAGTPQPGGTFNWFRNKNDILDPQRVSAIDQQTVSGVYSRIFAFKTGANPELIADHELEPDLGLSAESPDAVSWTVKLRPDAKFHNVAPVNGHPVEAEDIKATFVRAIDPANPNRGSLDYLDPAQIQTPDKQTVVFKLKYPYAPFRNTLASPAYSLIQPREALAGTYDPTKLVIGSGPFILESYTPDIAAMFKKNPEYYLKGRPSVDAMKMAIIPDASQQLAQFTGGNLDEIGASSLQQFTAFDIDSIRKANPKAAMFKTRYGIPNGVMFQLGDPKSPFQDVRVRQAFSMAIDRDALSKAVWGGESEQVILIPSYMGKWALRVQDLDPKIRQYYTYNPGEAKKLLEAAGATNLQIKLTWANAWGTPSFVKHAETIGNSLNAAGIKSTLVVVDFNKDYIAGGKGMKNGVYAPDTVLLIGQSSYTEADEFLFNYFDSKSSARIEGLNDPTYDAMVDKQRTIVNEDDRLKAVLDIQRYLAEKLYGLSTVGTYNWTFISPRVQNYQYSSSLGRATETYSKLWLKS
jgi:peptide/nickel transport system substrate-binding protein